MSVSSILKRSSTSCGLGVSTGSPPLDEGAFPLSGVSPELGIKASNQSDTSSVTFSELVLCILLASPFVSILSSKSIFESFDRDSLLITPVLVDSGGVKRLMSFFESKSLPVTVNEGDVKKSVLVHSISRSGRSLSALVKLSPKSMFVSMLLPGLATEST